MSKSMGNVIDPMSVIEHYGTDAFRFTLAAFAAQGRDVKMSEKRIEGYRHFINKLWNATRFSLMHIDKAYDKIGDGHLPLVDRWILSRLHRVAESVSEDLDSYRFNDAAAALYKFVWHELCDWYLEAIKPTLYDETDTVRKEATLSVLWRILRDTIVLLHPFIPFVTEEIWHKLPGTQGSIMHAVFPLDTEETSIRKRDAEAEAKMNLLTGVISGIRNVRGEMNISPSLPLSVTVQSDVASVKETIVKYQDMIVNLARLSSIAVEKMGKRPASAATAVVDEATIFVLLEGIIDVKKEQQRLEKEINKLGDELSVVAKKLNNEDFLEKAPAHVVAKVKEKHATLLEKQERLQSNLDKIKAFEA